MSKDEDPGDIFVDIADYGDDLTLVTRLRKACGSLLNTFSEAETLPNATPLGELCWVSGRIGADSAVDGLTTLAERPDTSIATLPNGESLRVRALRCLVGLLASYRDRVDSERHRALFEGCLAKPGCELIALTALVGLWPEKRDDFIDRLPDNYVLRDRALEKALAVVGFKQAKRDEASAT